MPPPVAKEDDEQSWFDSSVVDVLFLPLLQLLNEIQHLVPERLQKEVLPPVC